MKLILSHGIKTSIGKNKEYNSDAIIDFPLNKGHIYVVCDGHDGPEGHGTLAARLTADSLKKYFHNSSYKDIDKALANAITYANYTVFEQSLKDEKYRGMGSTLAVLVYYNNKIYYAYAGDSRISLWRDEKLSPLTRDHVDASTLHVTNLVGTAKDIKFGICKNPIEPIENDVFVISTDGLTDAVDSTLILEIVADPNTFADHKVQLLIDKAIELGSTDNISVGIVEFKAKPEKAYFKTPNFPVKKVLAITLAIIAIAALSFGGYTLVTNFLEKKATEDLELAELNGIKMPVADKKANKKELKEEKKAKEKEKEEREQKIEKAKESKKENKPKEEAKPNNDSETTIQHKVGSGENLYRIAIRYGVTQVQLKEINGKKAENLIAGSKLNIPVKAMHTVGSGESFSSISNKYGVKTSRICEANKIDASKPLKPGQKIIIPFK